MATRPTVNVLSLSVCKLQFCVLRNDGELKNLSVGTGFFFEDRGANFLVTNRHLVDGTINKNILATNLEVYVTATQPSDDADCAAEGAFQRKEIVIPMQLYDDLEDPHAPLGQRWWSHRNKLVDVVVIPLAGGPMDPETWAKLESGPAMPPPVCLEPDPPDLEAMDVVVVAGFPQSDYVDSMLPIYKGAMVASEPQLPARDGLPYFLVDGKTKTGMSGSPVFRNRSITTFGQEGGTVTAIETPQRWLVGVYASRDHEDEHLRDLELGKVWHSDVIVEIIDQIEHQPSASNTSEERR